MRAQYGCWRLPAAGLTTNTTTLPVAAGAYAALGSPATPFDVQIGQEIQTVSAASNSAGNWTVTRNVRVYDGSTAGAVNHPSGSTIKLISGYPEIYLAGRSTAAGSGQGAAASVGIKRLSAYNWSVNVRDGFDCVAAARINNGKDLNGVQVDVALLCRSSKITAYWKWADRTFWQPITSWTPTNGAAGNLWVGLDAIGFALATGQFDYVRIRQLQ